MDIFAVGGSVRDLVMGVAPRDFDYVIVGSCHENLIDLGFKQVGKAFPVYTMHGDEYALARTEKYVDGKRTVCFSPDVSLKDDLMRRDLTINSMALSADGSVIDYFGGVRDVEKKILRHVSKSFDNDPIRVLRVARFMARFSNFSVAEETMLEMKRIVNSGELSKEPRERLWKEISRALSEVRPDLFFKTLLECGALDVIMPEISRLSGVPQSAEHHPEIDTFVHVMMSLRKVSELTDDPLIRFSALVHDLGKGVTEKRLHPRHFGHEELGVVEVKSLCERLGAPKEYLSFGVFSSKYHTHIHNFDKLRSFTIVDMFDHINAYRTPYVVEMLAMVSKSDALGRLGFEKSIYNNDKKLRLCFDICRKISFKDFVVGIDSYDVGKIKDKLRAARAKSISVFFEKNKNFGVEL